MKKETKKGIYMIGIILIAIIMVLILIVSITKASKNNIQETEVKERVNESNSNNAINKSNNKNIEIDYTFIGDIKIGCSKSEFEKGIKSFLSKNRTLNGLKVQEYIDFYDNRGKLVRLILLSEQYKGERQKNSNYKENSWYNLYEEKYKDRYKDCNKFSGNGLSIDNGVFTIEVFDNLAITTLPKTYTYDFEFDIMTFNYVKNANNESLKRAAICKEIDAKNAYYGYTRIYDKPIYMWHSMIDIYDSKFIQSEKERLLKEFKDKKMKSKSLNLDAI